ncbi:hypothetical protein ACS0TY_005638 [Phlomoides rotata]
MTKSASQISTYNPRTGRASQLWYSDAELKRKKRVAKYKLYTVEGKIKKSWKKAMRWFRKTCSKIVHEF